MIQELAKDFFETHFGKAADECVILAQSGSARVNFKASNPTGDYIITFNENLRENASFLYFSGIFQQLHLNTPQIFAVSDDRKMYIQEFLGTETLSDIIAVEGISLRVTNLVKQTLVKLFELQTKTRDRIDYTQTFEYESYDELPVMHDLYYFKNFIADVLDLEYHKSTLLKEFKKIVQLIGNLEPEGLMIRDFQSRNMMINNEDRVSFIDYQSAMKGPLMYDVISFLFQAKANFPDVFKNQMLNFYINQFEDDSTKTQLKNSVQPVQLMRFLQVLGAYGFRGLVQRKAHFISSLEKGIQNITEFSENWEDMKNYPELKNVIKQLNSERTKLKIEGILKH